MIVLVEGKENTVWVEADNAVNISGFQATLAACGTVKTITDLSVKNPKFVFTASESDPQWNEVYGELRVTDGDGNLYLKWAPQFKVVSQDKAYEAVGNQKMVLSIPYNYDGSSSGGDGSGGTSGSGVTQAQLREAVEESKGYTDEKIADVGTVAIETTQVEVVDKDGDPVTMTVKESVQKVQTVSEKVTEIIEKGITGYTLDEDGDGQPDEGVLYFGVKP